VKDFTAALSLNPRDPMLYYFRADGRIDAGDAQGAVADATRALELDPNLECAYTVRARALERLGRRVEARSDYEKALETAETEPERSKLRKRIEQLLDRGAWRPDAR
jgi:Flp pilus assembly protein TadD